jgi:general secretion pathway protein L
VWISHTRQQAALAELDAATRDARARADKLTAARDATSTARQEELVARRLLAQIEPRVRIVDELSRILPDSAWLAEMRIDPGSVEISGFARSAAALVPALEGAALFADVTLTAPITIDDSQKMERFSYRMRLRAALQEPAPSSQSDGAAP